MSPDRRSSDGAGPASSKASKRPRRWWFPLVAAAIPVLLLLGLNFVLWLFGFGYPTHFFLPGRIQGKAVCLANHDFTRRFFPPGLERAPELLAMDATKPPATCRIFVFGESAAQGDPAPSFGFARILEQLLRARYPGRHFEVVNVAITAINSHVHPLHRPGLRAARR